MSAIFLWRKITVKKFAISLAYLPLAALDAPESERTHLDGLLRWDTMLSNRPLEWQCEADDETSVLW